MKIWYSGRMHAGMFWSSETLQVIDTTTAVTSYIDSWICRCFGESQVAEKHLNCKVTWELQSNIMPKITLPKYSLIRVAFPAFIKSCVLKNSEWQITIRGHLFFCMDFALMQKTVCHQKERSLLYSVFINPSSAVKERVSVSSPSEPTPISIAN